MGERMVKTVTLHARVTLDQKDEIHRIAQQLDRTESYIVRRCIEYGLPGLVTTLTNIQPTADVAVGEGE